MKSVVLLLHQACKKLDYLAERNTGVLRVFLVVVSFVWGGVMISDKDTGVSFLLGYCPVYGFLIYRAFKQRQVCYNAGLLILAISIVLWFGLLIYVLVR